MKIIFSKIINYIIYIEVYYTYIITFFFLKIGKLLCVGKIIRTVRMYVYVRIKTTKNKIKIKNKRYVLLLLLHFFIIIITLLYNLLFYTRQ